MVCIHYAPILTRSFELSSNTFFYPESTIKPLVSTPYFENGWGTTVYRNVVSQKKKGETDCCQDRNTYTISSKMKSQNIAIMCHHYIFAMIFQQIIGMTCHWMIILFDLSNDLTGSERLKSIWPSVKNMRLHFAGTFQVSSDTQPFKETTLILLTEIYQSMAHIFDTGSDRF